jgi:hypothetical protein
MRQMNILHQETNNLEETSELDQNPWNKLYDPQQHYGTEITALYMTNSQCVKKVFSKVNFRHQIFKNLVNNSKFKLSAQS